MVSNSEKRDSLLPEQINSQAYISANVVLVLMPIIVCSILKGEKVIVGAHHNSTSAELDLCIQLSAHGEGMVHVITIPYSTVRVIIHSESAERAESKARHQSEMPEVDNCKFKHKIMSKKIIAIAIEISCVSAHIY